MSLFDRLQQTTAVIRAAIGSRQPTVGLILGSGLGAFADKLEHSVVLDYADLPHFPRSHVHGHAGRLVIGERAGVTAGGVR